METTYAIFGYLLMAFIWGGALVKELTWRDVLASYLVGMTWPVSLPSRLLRRLMR